MARAKKGAKPTAPAAKPTPTVVPVDPIDQAVRTRNLSALPAELHTECKAIWLAFNKYESGLDEEARAALQTIGLKSPFQDWKLLIRGLMAYSASDDARAVENWQRLQPTKVPAQLAAPLWASIDAAYMARQPEAVATRLVEQFQTLQADPIHDGLRELRGLLGRGRPLTNTIRAFERLVPGFRHHNIKMIPRLGNILYRAILNHGQPDDVPKYIRIFGRPNDDPDFHRMNAMGFEKGEQFAEAIEFWTKYDNWLSKHPAGWPADLEQRARAMILNHIGVLADEYDELVANGGLDELQTAFRMLMGSGRGMPTIQPRPAPDPVPFWQRAITLAPDWEEPARELFDYFMESGKKEEAEAVALKLITHNPHAVGMMTDLARLYTQTNRPEKALEFYQKALTSNPLDKALRTSLAYGYLAQVRKHVELAEMAEATAIMTAQEELCRTLIELEFRSLQAVLALRQGNKEAAEAFRQQAEALPYGKLAALYLIVIDAALLRVKPAVRKPYELALTKLWTQAATPREILRLELAYNLTLRERPDYHGSKTHIKKIEDLYLKSIESGESHGDFELLGLSCVKQEKWKLLTKFAAKLSNMYPNQPEYIIFLAVADSRGKASYRTMWKVHSQMRQANRLLQSTNHKLSPQMTELANELSQDRPYEVLDL